MRKHRYTNQINAVKAANTGKTLTSLHKSRISKAMNDRNEKIVVVQVTKDEDTKLFLTATEASRFLGCSKQLVCQCLRHPETYKTCRGWKVEELTIAGKED